MSTYPKNRAEFLSWCQAHAPVWAADPAAIGLESTQTGMFTALAASLQSKVTAQTTAKEAAKSATVSAKDTEVALRTAASDLVRSIRAYATNQDDPSVYVTAQIPPPATPSPVPPPGQPTDFSVGLESSGAITLRWKAQNPVGGGSVVYFVSRRLASQSAFTLLGGTGEKKFTDETLPVGSAGATYIITPQRGQVTGTASLQLNVTFGVVGAGPGATVSVSESASPVRLAA